MALKKQIIAGAVGAFVTGLLFHIVFPAAVGVALAVIISGLTILDPLYAGERVQTIWSNLEMILMIQVLNTLITATIVGGFAGYLVARLQKLWLYLVGALVSMLLHYGFLFIIIESLSVITERNFGQVWGISMMIVTLVGPIIGLVSAFAAQRSSTKATTKV